MHEFPVDINCSDGVFGVRGGFVQEGFYIRVVGDGPLRQRNVEAGEDKFGHVMSGDIITTVNGESAKQMHLFQDAVKNRGVVHLTIARPARLAWALEHAI